MTAAEKRFKSTSFLLCVGWFWIVAILCGITAQNLKNNRPFLSFVSERRIADAAALATRLESYDLTLKYLDGIAEATLSLERIPGQVDWKELDTLTVIAGQLSNRLAVDRFTLAGQWMTVYGHGREDAAERLSFLMKRDEGFQTVEFAQTPLPGGDVSFIIRCQRQYH